MTAPEITALVLAAGQSRRMDGAHKLLATAKGQPIIRHTVENILASRADHVGVVTGYDNKRVEAALHGLPVSFVYNPDYAIGLASSLALGITALDSSVDAALICLGDMPRVTPQVMGRLIAAFDPASRCAICAPTHKGVQGNPILWAKQFFPEIKLLSGDQGAKDLLRKHTASVMYLDMPDEPGVAFDIDTPTDLTEFQQSLL